MLSGLVAVQEWIKRRPVTAAALFYALLAVAMVAPALIPGHTLASTDLLWTLAPWTADMPEGVRGLGSNWELADAVAYFQPALEYTRDRLPHMPLWNPLIQGGRPFHGSMQPAVFSPFSWPTYVLPFWWSLGVVGALKLWVPAFGMFLLARRLGQSFAAALLAGTVAGFGLFYVVWLAWPLSSVWAWLPWLLLLTDRVVRSPGALPVVGLAAVVGVQYTGGHPESSFHVLAATAGFALLRMQGWRGLGRFAVAVLAGTALAAAIWLPFLELLWHSSDLDSREGREPARSALKYLLGIALTDFWGRPTQLVTEPFIIQRAFYAGALPLLLAALAVLLKPTRERVIIAAAGAVALLVVVGVEPFFTVVHWLPGFSQAHNTRLAIITLLAVALLAGWGLDSLRPSRWLAPVAVAFVVLPVIGGWLENGRSLPHFGDALASAWGFVTPTDVEVLPLLSILIWVPFAVAAAVLVVRRPAWLPVAAVALVVADLFRAGMGQNPAIPVANATLPVTPAMRELADGRFVAVGGPLLTPLTANVGMRYGLRDARGYDYPTERRYDALWKRAVNPPGPFDITPPTNKATAGPEALQALGLLNVTRVLSPPDEPLPLREVYSGPDARVYENPRATPRTYVVGRERVVEDQLSAVLEPSFEATDVAVVSAPLRLNGAGQARIVRDDPERVTVRAETRGGHSLVVLADTYFPGWKAKADGRTVPIVRTQHLLRGVVVPAGTHTIEFRYEPWSWRVGWIASLVTAVALLGVAWRKR